MDDLYLSDVNMGMVSWDTLTMMHEAFGLSALSTSMRLTLEGAVPYGF